MEEWYTYIHAAWSQYMAQEGGDFWKWLRGLCVVYRHDDNLKQALAKLAAESPLFATLTKAKKHAA